MGKIKKSLIVSAFPACGNTYFHEKGNEYGFTTSDSDSSKFSWLLDENGESTGVRDYDFPENYIQHIKSLVGKVDFIFVSSHQEVRDALEGENLSYVIVHPSPTEETKQCWINRMRSRGNTENFIGMITSNWYEWNSPIKLRPRHKPLTGLFLGDNEYLSDKLWVLESIKEQQ